MKPMLHFLRAHCILWFLLSSSSLAQDTSTELGHAEFEAAMRLFAENTVSNAKSEYWRLMQLAAEKGHAAAQYYLGLGYSQMADYTNAAAYFQKSALQGYTPSQTLLALCYKDGFGVSANHSEAAKWFRVAAEKDDGAAQNNLALLFENGQGLPKDSVIAVTWWKRAVQNGNRDALYNLGEHYRAGVGIPRDEIEAYACFNVGAAMGDEKAKSRRDLYDSVWKFENAKVAIGRQRAKELHAEIETNKQRVAQTKAADAKRFNSDSEPKGFGSGFVLATNGVIITNYHVVQGALRVEVVTCKGRTTAKVIATDPGNDIAALSVKQELPEALPVRSSRGVALGTDVFTIGFPNPTIQGFSPKFTRGEISSVAGPADDPRYFQISVPVQPGNSGGALCDSEGRVIAIVAARLNAANALATSGALPENVNYAVKSSYMLAFLEALSLDSDKFGQLSAGTSSKEEARQRAQNAAVLVLVF